MAGRPPSPRPDAPIVVGVLGADDLQAELADAVRGRVGRRAGRWRCVRLRPGDPLDRPARAVRRRGRARAHRPRSRAAAQARGRAGRHRIDDALDPGSTINFVVSRRPRALRGRARRPRSAPGLKLSSRLLAVAQNVRMGNADAAAHALGPAEGHAGRARDDGHARSLVAAVAMLLYETRAYRTDHRSDLQTQADIVGRASAPALAFDDPSRRGESRAAARAAADPRRGDRHAPRQVFATYGQAPAGRARAAHGPATDDGVPHRGRRDRGVFHPIVENGRVRSGRVVILRALRARVAAARLSRHPRGGPDRQPRGRGAAVRGAAARASPSRSSR